MSTLRIAIIGNQAFAMINFRGALIRRLVAEGHEVLALVPDYSGPTRAAVAAMGATPLDHNLSRAGMNPWVDARATWQLRQALRKIAPDLVLAYTVKPVVYGIIAAWLAGVQRRYALIEGLGHVFIHSGSLKKRLLQWCVSMLYRVALGLATKALFLNSDDRADFITQTLVSERKTQIVGTIGVDLNDWAATPTVVDPITFLVIGRMLYEKGIAEFVAAAKQVRVDFPSTRFVVVGDIDSNPSSLKRDALMAWVAEGIIEWPGHAEVKPWIAQSSVFVLPSYREGFPRATQEAMAMGRPVITTNVPGCRETVIEGVNGFLVPPRDATALAAAMRRFIDRPSLIAAMGASSRQIAEQRFGVVDATARLVDAMEIPAQTTGD